jgi:hypothetical protein
MRMIRAPEVGLDDLPLLWLELFDHSTKTSLDSCCCYRIEDAASILQKFISQAGGSNESSGTQ